MAVRVKVWQRGIASQFTFTGTGSVTAPVSFVAGTTLLRLRYSVVIVSHADVPFAELPASQVVMGTILLDESPIPPAPDPLVHPDEDWLWYEGMAAIPYQHPIVAPTYVTLQGPADGGVRDVKAERIFAHDNPVLAWSWSQSIDPAFTPSWSVQVTYSALLFTAP